MKISSSILCADVGFRHTGLAIWSIPQKRFVKTYVISTEKDSGIKYVALDNVQRLRHLLFRIGTIIDEVNPQFAVAEMPVGSSRNARAATKMAMAFSMFVSICYLKELSLEMVSPYEIKKLINKGSRKAVSKGEVINYVSNRFGADHLPNNAKKEHVADAMACIDAYFLSKSGRLPSVSPHGNK